MAENKQISKPKSFREKRLIVRKQGSSGGLPPGQLKASLKSSGMYSPELCYRYELELEKAEIEIAQLKEALDLAELIADQFRVESEEYANIIQNKQNTIESYKIVVEEQDKTIRKRIIGEENVE